MRRFAIPALLALVVVLAGCGDETVPAEGAGDVPITHRAIAAMTLEHAPDDTTRREATWADRSYHGGGLGADLRYHATGESDGGLLRVFVTPERGPKDPCADAESWKHCESRHVDEGTLTLIWQREEPEEDGGFVEVTLQRADETVSVAWLGDPITRDPRKMDLFVPVDTLEEIAQDERISMTTSQVVVDAGADLDEWEGREVGDRYDRVPSTDQGIGWGYWLAAGGYSRYHDLRPSPLKAEFGEGTIGARFDADQWGRDLPAQTIDVVAAPQAPDWMSADVCESERFAGHCLAAPGKKGPRWFAWVPGPAGTGEIWTVAQRDDEVVAFRYSDLDVPEAQRAAQELVEWWNAKELLNDYRIGLMTDQEVLDADL